MAIRAMLDRPASAAAAIARPASSILSAAPYLTEPGQPVLVFEN